MSILSAAHPQYVVVTMAKNRSAAQAPRELSAQREFVKQRITPYTYTREIEGLEE